MTQSPAKPDPTIVVPGRSIGPLSIGMTPTDCARLGLELRPHPSGQLGEAVKVAGPYQIVLREGRVASISLRLRDAQAGISINHRSFGSDATFEQIVKALPECGEIEEREGGTLVTCSGGTTLVKSGSENGTVEIQVVAPGFFD